MELNFRKRVTILPGLTLNFGKRGTNVTVGKRGASMTFGKNGTYANVGIPGTGISYQRNSEGHLRNSMERRAIT